MVITNSGNQSPWSPKDNPSTCPICTGLARLALTVLDPREGEIYRIYACDRCGRILSRK